MTSTPRRTSTFRAVLLFLGLAVATTGCRVPPELDPESALPQIEAFDRESDRPKIAVAVDESLDANVLPEGLMARGTSSRDPRPIDRLRRTIMEGMRATRHFSVVEPDENPEYLLKFTVAELSVDNEDDIGCIDWFSYKFFGLYRISTARLGATVYDARSNEPIGADIEQFGKYQILEGKAFRSYEDKYANLLGMSTGFSKDGGDMLAMANALQKAIVRLIADVSVKTTLTSEAPAPLIKDVE